MSPSSEERLARLALNAICEPGDPRVARLVQALGPVEVHDRLLADTDLQGLRSETAERLATLDPARLHDQAAGQGIRFLVPGDPEWPAGLDDLAGVEPLHQLTGAPLGLWVRGPLRLDTLDGAATRAPTQSAQPTKSAQSVAVVGSRSATTYGADVAAELSSTVAQAGAVVVSGAAFGIDQAAHRAALAVRGRTVAVLACGVDRAYPVAHRGLLEVVAEVGALVSELRPGCAPTRLRFLGRNRLIAAMTRGTVVVEAAVRSGALNTASWAGRLGRVVMGVPGPVSSASSEGVHELIRSGAAALVTRGDHVLELVSPAGTHLAATPRAPERPRDRLGTTEQRVLEAVPLFRGATVSAVARTAGLGSAAVLAALHALRELGWVTESDSRWRRATAR